MKYETVSEETSKLFDDVFLLTSLAPVLSFKVVHSKKLKFNDLGYCGKVYKTSHLIKSVLDTNAPDFIIVINEDVFIRLEDNQQKVIAEKILAQLGFNYEKDECIVITPDVQEFSGILKKHDYNSIEAIKMAVESIFHQLKESEDSQPKKRGRKPKS